MQLITKLHGAGKRPTLPKLEMPVEPDILGQPTASLEGDARVDEATAFAQRCGVPGLMASQTTTTGPGRRPMRQQCRGCSAYSPTEVLGPPPLMSPSLACLQFRA